LIYHNIYQNCVNFIFTISSFKFTKSNFHDLIANEEWPPIHLTSKHWTIRYRSNAGVLSQAATKAKNSCRV